MYNSFQHIELARLGDANKGFGALYLDLIKEHQILLGSRMILAVCLAHITSQRVNKD